MRNSHHRRPTPSLDRQSGRVLSVVCGENADPGIKSTWLPKGVQLVTQPEPVAVKVYLPRRRTIYDEMYRSQSVDLSTYGRGERYLSRWSRENTPIDSGESYRRNVRRSFTPVREVSSYEVFKPDRRRAYSVDPYNRTPIGLVTKPYHTNMDYYSENQPIRKYDVFQVRTWAYPIYKYIYGRDEHHSRPYSYTRQYATTSLYTPPVMTPELRSMTTRRGYSGYNYVAGEHSFNISEKPWSMSNYRVLRSPHVTTAPWYWYGSRGNTGTTRHYNSYRPRPHSARLSSYWRPYF